MEESWTKYKNNPTEENRIKMPLFTTKLRLAEGEDDDDDDDDPVHLKKTKTHPNRSNTT